MKLHDLKPAPGSTRDRIRSGRGIAAGRGKTAGKGTKGQTARSGGRIAAWFEGGQTPIHIRIPKLRGFDNISRVEVAVVNVGRIQSWIDAGRLKGDAPITVNADVLAAAGLLKSRGKPLKVLGSGELKSKLFVLADAFTESAIAKITAAGGTAQAYEAPAADAAAPVEAKQAKKPAPKTSAKKSKGESEG